MIFLLTRESADYDGQDIEDLIIAWSSNLEMILKEINFSEYYCLQIIFLPESGGNNTSIEYLGITNDMDENFLKYPPLSFDENIIERIYPILNKWCDSARGYINEKIKLKNEELERRERKEYERLKRKFE